MSKRLFVGNLPFSTTDEEIRDLFSQHGTVHSVNLISDRETGRPRGFGFVEMEEGDAESAIQALDGTTFGGRDLKVNVAQPRTERTGRSRDGDLGGW